MRSPPPLAAGARVALIAPAGPIRDSSGFDRAAENARRFGWEVQEGAHVRNCDGYLAGRDEDRAADLNWAANDPAIDGVWCMRGGYGSMRLLERVDYDAWRRHPKPLMGYSDVTALHAAIGARAGLMTFHAPTARSELTAFTSASFERAVVRHEDPCGVAAGARTLVGGRASGRVVGGNLALLAALSGTPYAPDFTGAILFVEDVNESVYRIDRMLTHLRLTGALGACAGMVFGHFTDIPPEPTDSERSVDDVLAEVAVGLGVPCIAGAPMGHIGDQWTLPLGGTAILDADACRVEVGFP